MADVYKRQVKIYQAGIRSRISAYEIANLYDDDLWEKSIRTYKQDLIDHADYYKNQVSENAALWIDLLVRFSKRKFIKIKKVPNFRYGKVHKRTKRLMARIINDKQYLVSPNFSVINEIGESDIDFSKVSNICLLYTSYGPEHMRPEVTVIIRSFSLACDREWLTRKTSCKDIDFSSPFSEICRCDICITFCIFKPVI